jgi:hypothetical protein
LVTIDTRSIADSLATTETFATVDTLAVVDFADGRLWRWSTFSDGRHSSVTDKLVVNDRIGDDRLDWW